LSRRVEPALELTQHFFHLAEQGEIHGRIVRQ
jgi:hypothetical protein